MADTMSPAEVALMDGHDGMLTMYEIFHSKHIQAAATVKGLLSLYRDKEK